MKAQKMARRLIGGILESARSIEDAAARQEQYKALLHLQHAAESARIALHAEYKIAQAGDVRVEDLREGFTEEELSALDGYDTLAEFWQDERKRGHQALTAAYGLIPREL